MQTNSHNPSPSDAQPQEAALAALLQATGELDVLELRQRGAGGGLRARMLLAARAAHSPMSTSTSTSTPTSTPVPAVRLAVGGWAVAAGLLVAIGMGGFFLLHGSTPVGPGGSSPAVAVEHTNAGTSPREDIVLREDGALSLFHDIETFGSLGVDPDDLLALGE